MPPLITPTDRANPALLPLITELDDYLAALYPSESNHGLDWVALQDPSVTVLLAKVGDEIAGCGAIKQLTDAVAEVKRMYVRPQFRGQGLGKQLLRAIESLARERQIATLRLETGIYQPEALGLYEKAGFYPIPPFADYQPDPLSVFYEKRLDPTKQD